MPAENFTGEAWIDSVNHDTENGVMIGNVMFTPGAHTNWHTHERGQILKVLAGSGWVCDKGGEPKRLAVGDTVWCPPGTVHWHGADDGCYMMHTAISLGKTSWMGSSDEEYAKKK